MTEGPQTPDPNQQPEGQSVPPPYGEPVPPPYQQQPPEQPYQQQYQQQPPPQPGYQQPYQQQPGYPPNPAAPYGVHPVTGIPYSDKTKLVAGLLQILLPFGIGRFYLGDTKTGVWQLVVTLVTCGIGALWPFIDGIIILATDNVTDSQGRPLRMS
ncbi:MAG TPA: TM2 domain-containing protein [Nocardioides sp.]|nr:TM2 domain-containing protein [Nocardioides sp.]